MLKHSTRGRKLIVLLIPILIGIGFFLYLNLSKKAYITFWHCPLLEGFGIACPGCGATRSVCSILTFKFKKAIEYNLLVFTYFFILSGAYVYNIYKVIRHNKSISIKSSYIWVSGILVIGFAIIRNLSFYPWAILSP